MELSHLQEQLLLENIILDEDMLGYCNDFLLLLERFGQRLLRKKWHQDFNPEEEMFVRNLSREVEELGGNIPKEKLGKVQRAIMALMIPIIGFHFNVNLGNINADDVAYTLKKLNGQKIEKISERVRNFVVHHMSKKKGG